MTKKKVPDPLAGLKQTLADDPREMPPTPEAKQESGRAVDPIAAAAKKRKTESGKRTIYLPNDLWRALKIYAVKNDLSASQIIAELVRQHLSRHGAGGTE